MPTKILKDIELSQSYIDAIDKRLVKFFQKEIFGPLLGEIDGYLNPKTIINSQGALQEALLKGKVSYYRGYFTGKFNSRISKDLKSIGAELVGGKWKLSRAKLPYDVLMTISTSESSWLRAVDKINRRIDSLLEQDLEERIDLSGIIDKAVFSLNRDIEDEVKGFAIAPNLTQKNIEDIANNYTNNVRYYVRDFTNKQVLSLREKVNKNTMAGYRYEGLAKEIQKSFNVSKSKANFLARQETNLLVAKFKESRYTEMGINEYIWQTVVGSPAHPVRPMHKALNGTTQRFDNPPVVNEKGDRKNPGEDFGCRCKARPVVRF